MGYITVTRTAIAIVIAVLVRVVSAFNIETQEFVTHKGIPDSRFGFSVTQHRDSNGPWVLVGAPESETDQEEVVRGGAVFRCHPAHGNDCTPIPFDLTGNHWEAGRQIENKSMQWFGAHVTSSSGVVVACAPRYVWLRPYKREPVGRCFYGTARHTDGYAMFSPCMASARWGYHQQGSCQAGYAASITQNGNRMYVGALGSYYWQGQIFYQDLLNTREHLETPEAGKEFDMSYLGYSITSGEFTGDAEEDIAVGMPRGDELRGKVVILSHQLQAVYNISGDQLGSYFGYSVTSADVNGDDLQDLIIGAPWHSHIGNTASYEGGRVAVFTQTIQHNFKLVQSLHGITSRGHFGLAVTSLRDLNRDGFEDFAVGAPNSGDSGAGEVFIYLGTKDGPSDKPSQVLSSEVLTQGTIRTFGWSLSGGDDLDENDYPDLVIGAHTSDAALVFLTRPVVRVNSTIKFRSAKGIIDLDVKGCSLQDGAPVPCVSLLYCLNYDGHRVPSKLKLDVSVRLDVLAEVSPRMYFLKRERERDHETTLELRKSVENCTTVYTYVEPQIHDKLTPLEAELKAGITEGQWSRGELQPILAPTLSRSKREKARIYVKNNCGDDNVCVPDLSVHIYREQAEYIIGSQEHISLKLHIANTGEDSFQTILRSDLPSEVSYASFTVLKEPKDVTPICFISDRTEGEEVVCEIGNPLPSNTEVTLTLNFQPQRDLEVADLFFSFTVSSASKEVEEEEEEDNTADIKLPVVMRSLVDIKGISIPEGTFEYNKTRYSHTPDRKLRDIEFEAQIGPEIEHIYDITNSGPSPLPRSTLYLLWPTRTLNNDPLLYLLDEPVMSGAECEVVRDVNYLGIKIDESRRIANNPTVLSKKEKAERRTEEDSGMSNSYRHQRRRRKRRRRRRRSMEEIERELHCGPTNCTRVVCDVRSLAPNSNIVIRVRSRLWIDTIEKLGMSEVSISSRAILTTVSARGLRLWKGNVSSVISVGERHAKTSLKWLVITGSVVTGLLLLALLCAVLWAMGFFKRKRPQDGPESEPLSRNGYYNTSKT